MTHIYTGNKHILISIRKAKNDLYNPLYHELKHVPVYSHLNDIFAIFVEIS